MEMIEEYGLNRMGENDDDEDEDDNNEGNTVAPLFLCPLLPHLWRSMMKSLWTLSLSKKPQCRNEVISADAKPKMMQPHLYHALMRDYEESPLRMMDDMDNLDDDPNEGCSDMDEWFLKMGVMIVIESSSLNL
jgi:hypothetical protein